MKVNAILDDASNESFMNEEVAGLLGLKATWQTVQVRVLNDSVETFKSMPLQIEIESVTLTGNLRKPSMFKPARKQLLEVTESWTGIPTKRIGHIFPNAIFRFQVKMGLLIY